MRIPIPAYVRLDPRSGIVKVDAHMRNIGTVATLPNTSTHAPSSLQGKLPDIGTNASDSPNVPNAPSAPSAPISKSVKSADSLIEAGASARRKTRSFRVKAMKLREEQKATYEEFLNWEGTDEQPLPKELSPGFDWKAEHKRYLALYGREEGENRFYGRVSYIRDCLLPLAHAQVREGRISPEEAVDVWDGWRESVPTLPIPKKAQKDGEKVIKELRELGTQIREQMLDSMDPDSRNVLAVLKDRYDSLHYHRKELLKASEEMKSATWQTIGAKQRKLAEATKNYAASEARAWNDGEAMYAPVRQHIFETLRNLRAGFGTADPDWDTESADFIETLDTGEGEKTIASVLNNLYRLYPKEWAEAANDTGALHLGSVGERARYERFTKDISPQMDDTFPVIADPDTGESYVMSEVLLHETSHHIAQGNPSIGMLLAILYERRAKDQTAHKMDTMFQGRGYDSMEVSVPDDWAHPYMGLDYDMPSVTGQPLSDANLQGAQMSVTAGLDEMLSMMFERLFTGQLGGTIDARGSDDEIDLLIGMLVGF